MITEDVTMRTPSSAEKGAERPSDPIPGLTRLGLWLSLLTAVIVPGVGLAWHTAERLDRLEIAVHEARLPETSERLTRIERDVDWIRKEIERKK